MSTEHSRDEVLYLAITALLEQLTYDEQYSIVMNLSKYVLCSQAEARTPDGKSPIPRYQFLVDQFAKTIREMPSRYALIIKRTVQEEVPDHVGCGDCETCKAAKVGEELELLDRISGRG
jgi:hypothetical protein